jgi:NACHT domain
LRLTDPRDDKKRIEETKGGLLKDSYRWILDNADFQQWRGDRQSRLLWIKGDPGKGKTMLLCGIINELNKSIAKTALLLYFFCQATDSRINNAMAVLRGLIYMLISQQPSVISHIRKKYDHAGKSLFDDANTWVALVEIFTDMVQDPNLNFAYIIIDALDECVTDLPKLLGFIVQSSLSSRVKWIVSSRNWPNIEERLKQAGQNLSLELNVNAVSRAVKFFIEYKVDKLAQLKSYNNETRDAVFDHLSSNANDTFLWVALVCQNLEEIPRWKTVAKLSAFPPGLGPLYERMVEQIRISDDASLCKRILATIALTYRPLTLKELASGVEELEDMSNDLASIQEIVGLCGSFLTTREDAIYFVHQSAKDYLLAQASNEIFPSGKDDAHHVIFSRSLQVMSRTLRRDIYSLRVPGYPIEQVKQLEPDPLAASRYSCVYWVDHLYNSRTNSTANLELLLRCGRDIDIFLKDKYLYWLEALSICRSMSDGVVSMAKLEALLQVILKLLLLRIVYTNI